jgi:hypothetical protein
MNPRGSTSAVGNGAEQGSAARLARRAGNRMRTVRFDKIAGDPHDSMDGGGRATPATCMDAGR